MPKFRKKPVVIEAIQWTGDNFEKIEKLARGFRSLYVNTKNTIIYIITLEGEMEASLNDWIIKGVAGEIYPCKPDIFEQTYEYIENET